MNLHQLSIFYAIAEAGSVNRGAERLFISQPAVSKQLAELERSLGVRLFDRLPKGVRPTEAGELLYGYARRLFALEGEAERALVELQGLQRGRLAIGASTTIGSYLLPEVMAQFHQQFPGIDLHLEIANTDVIQHRLLEGTLDVGLTEGFVEAEALEAQVFHEDELVAIAAPDHPLLAEAPVTATRLCREPFLLREPGSGTRAVLERSLQEKGLAVLPSMSLGSTEAIKRAVAAGAGVAIVSRLTIRSEQEAQKLSIVPLSDLVLRRPLHRLYLHGAQESRAVRAFQVLLDQELDSERLP